MDKNLEEKVKANNGLKNGIKEDIIRYITEIPDYIKWGFSGYTKDHERILNDLESRSLRDP